MRGRFSGGYPMPYYETIDAGSIHYVDEGAGPPLVFIHGWSYSRTVWSLQREFFSRRFRCILPDLRGHGDSSSPSSGYEVDEMGSDLLALFQGLDLSGATLVGWSLGVLVALSAYVALRKRLSAIVLVSGIPKFIASDEYPFGLPEKEIRGMALRLKRNPVRAYEEFNRMMFSRNELDCGKYEEMESEILGSIQRPATDVALRTLEALARADMRTVLSSIRIPALLVHGERDTICLPEASKYMASLIPGSSLCLMQDTGHAPFLSRKEAFNTVLTVFLETVYGHN